MKQEIKKKVNDFFGLVGRHKSIRWALVFVMLCLGIFIISASKISFFGINIERDLDNKKIERIIERDYSKDYNLLKKDVDKE